MVTLADAARDRSTQGNSTAPWFEGETTDLYNVDLGNGAWIRELTCMTEPTLGQFFDADTVGVTLGFN